jgi:hypothetical protein
VQRVGVKGSGSPPSRSDAEGADHRPLPPAEPGAAVEVDRVVNKTGIVSLAGRQILPADILGGRPVSIRIDAQTLSFFDPATRQLLPARPNPLSWDQVRRLRGACPAGPAPRPSTEPVTVQRRASATGVILVARQKIALGRAEAGQTVTVHVAEHTLTIETDGGPPHRHPDHHPAHPQPQGQPALVRHDQRHDRTQHPG